VGGGALMALLYVTCQFCDAMFNVANTGGLHSECPFCHRTFRIEVPLSDESGFVIVWDAGDN
jgi:hypothetical protein